VLYSGKLINYFILFFLNDNIIVMLLLRNPDDMLLLNKSIRRFYNNALHSDTKSLCSTSIPLTDPLVRLCGHCVSKQLVHVATDNFEEDNR